MKNHLCILAAALLCGCISAHIGHDFDASKISEIKKGDTTEVQLCTLFGQPNQRTTNSDTGVSLGWTYGEGQAGFGGATSSSKILIVWLDQSGKVTNFNYSTGSFSSSPGAGTNSTPGIKSPHAQ